jgi:hypothetical protein
MPLLPHYTTTPCRSCGEPIVIVTAAGGERITLDPTAPVFVRESDGEGGGVWAQDNSDTVLVRHGAVCKGSKRRN